MSDAVVDDQPAAAPNREAVLDAIVAADPEGLTMEQCVALYPASKINRANVARAVHALFVEKLVEKGEYGRWVATEKGRTKGVYKVPRTALSGRWWTSSPRRRRKRNRSGRGIRRDHVNVRSIRRWNGLERSRASCRNTLMK